MSETKAWHTYRQSLPLVLLIYTSVPKIKFLLIHDTETLSRGNARPLAILSELGASVWLAALLLFDLAHIANSSSSL